MATGQDSDQSLLDDAVLAKNHRADCSLGGGYLCPSRLRLAHDHVFELFQAFAGCCHHIRSMTYVRTAAGLASLVSKGCNIQANRPPTFRTRAGLESPMRHQIMPFSVACDPACMQVSHARSNFDGPIRLSL